MTFIVLFAGTLLILAAMLYLTLAVNEFEHKTKELAAMLEKRYTLVVPQKKSATAGPAHSQGKAAPAKT
jgi:hypothetical protein